MEREKRVIVGVTLTQLMYTIFMVISDGTIIFATPLNPILFGFTALYFSILNIKKRGMTLLMLILGFLSIRDFIIWRTAEQFLFNTPTRFSISFLCSYNINFCWTCDL
ncbi:MAG: hypothetical protein ACPG8K_03720 [Crocinitomicaceae bacterium]